MVRIQAKVTPTKRKKITACHQRPELPLCRPLPLLSLPLFLTVAHFFTLGNLYIDLVEGWKHGAMGHHHRIHKLPTTLRHHEASITKETLMIFPCTVHLHSLPIPPGRFPQLHYTFAKGQRVEGSAGECTDTHTQIQTERHHHHQAID